MLAKCENVLGVTAARAISAEARAALAWLEERSDDGSGGDRDE